MRQLLTTCLAFYMLGFLTLYVNLSHGKLNMFSILFIFVLGKINEKLKKMYCC